MKRWPPPVPLISPLRLPITLVTTPKVALFDVPQVRFGLLKFGVLVTEKVSRWSCFPGRSVIRISLESMRSRPKKPGPENSFRPTLPNCRPLGQAAVTAVQGGANAVGSEPRVADV